MGQKKFDMGDFEQGKRLKFIIEGCYKLTPVEFAKAYNDPKAVKTYHILSGRNGISNKMLEIILKAYPDINQGWLLTGEGEPIKKGPTAPSFVIPEEEKTVSIPSDAWQVIKQQAASLESKDNQLDRVISLLEDQIKENKKINAQRDGGAICADVAGSDLTK